MPSYPTLAVQMQFSGAGGAWTAITGDVLRCRLHYGIDGNGPLDRVANVGWCELVLDNSTGNSGGLVGYYSPLHANVRSGFAYGIGVRVALTFGGTTYYKWRGKIRDIEPTPGSSRDRITRVYCVDWMYEANEYEVREVSMQISQRSDQVVSAIVAAIPTQPAAQSIEVGQDTWTYAVDGGRARAVTLFQKVAVSELGLIYVKGDTTQGGTFVFEDRHERMATTTNSINFANEMAQLSVPRNLDQLYNRIEVSWHPTSIDAAATTVLYSLPQPQGGTVAAGESITIWGDYRDPNNKAVYVGGTAMVAPVATTDFTMNTASDGTGTNLTTNFTVTTTYFASTAKFVITNNHATSAGYITLLQCRGKGIYRYAPGTQVSEDTAGQTTYGLRPLQIDMPYQDSQTVAQGAADYLKNLYSSPLNQVDAITFDANQSSALLTAALAREISSRIGIDETVTGVTKTTSGADRGWYINAIELDLQPSVNGLLVDCTWTVAPGEAYQYWILGTVGASELDTATRLGYA